MSRRYTSGQFAELCHTTKETLFHYERLGLLKPHHTGKNGYRYYDIKQFLQFDMIGLFKESGTSLKDIAACLNSARLDNFLALLEEKEQFFRKERLRLERRENLVRQLRDVIRKAHQTPLDRLFLRRMPEMEVEIFPQTFHQLDVIEGLSAASATLMERYYDEGRYPGVPVGFLYPPSAFSAGCFARGEMFAPIEPDTPAQRRCAVPCGVRAFFAHRGTWRDQSHCWRGLPSLLKRHGLRLSGPALFLDMGSYASTGIVDDYIIHCQLPVSDAALPSKDDALWMEGSE